MQEIIYKLENLLTRRDKQFLLGLLFFSIIISLVETVGISLIMPFVAIATDFSLLQSNQYYHFLFTYFSFEKEDSFVIVFGILLILFYLLRGVMNFIYFHLLARFSQGRYHLFAYRLFQNYLGLPYDEFTQKNSSVLTKTLVTEAGNLTQMISAIVLMISEIFVVILLYSMMLYVNYKLTLLLSIVILVNIWILMKVISTRIKNAGQRREVLQSSLFEVINRSFGNFKWIKLRCNEDEVVEDFSKASYGLVKAETTNMTLAHLPRLFMEAVGFSLIVFIIIYLVWKYESSIASALALISMLMLALFRLMPSFNRILTAYNQIMFTYRALDIVHEDLMYNIQSHNQKKIEFDHLIDLQGVSFGFNESEVISDVSLQIPKGSKVALVGPSGSGKSTLVDLIMGLYKPQKGQISIDNVPLAEEYISAWRRKIGYIPQSIYLFDGTVAENVVFGNEYDEAQIDECLKQANIYEFLQSKEGQNTRVGENGVKLSGGQKQRIAIARALYTSPEILVLDEATSALDLNTHKQIMDTLAKSCHDKTVILIAHNLEHTTFCDHYYTIVDKKLQDINI